MSGFRNDGVLASDPPEMVTVERTYLVTIITQGRNENAAIEAGFFFSQLETVN